MCLAAALTTFLVWLVIIKSIYLDISSRELDARVQTFPGKMKQVE